MAEVDRTGGSPAQRFSLREAARILEVPEARLRALARAGLLAPQRGPIGLPSFGFQDLLLLRTTKGLIASGVPMPKIRRLWASLRHQLSDDVPLTSVSISTDGETVVASDGRSRWRPESGQMLLDFEASEIVTKAEEAAGVGTGATVTVPRTVAPEPVREVATAAPRASEPADEASFSAAEWYEVGCELEADSPERARLAYERAIDLDPGHVEAHLNLGRLLHLAGEGGRAEPHYREAVRLDPDDPTPHFNLGVLLDEIGRRDEAVLAYLQAIRRDPDFADAHCNVGLLLESIGRRQEAVRHLMAAKKLMGTEG
jgi:tetratricopeptide (TPR) repeat protein